EDKEYTIRLLRAGLAVRFVCEVGVWTAFPADHDQLRVQRERWTTGTFRFGKRVSLRLIAEGMLRRQFRRADARWTILGDIPPLILLQLVVTLGLALACGLAAPGAFSGWLLAGSALAAILHGAYWGLGAIRLGITPRRIALLRLFPVLAIRLVVIFVRGMMTPR